MTFDHTTGIFFLIYLPFCRDELLASLEPEFALFFFQVFKVQRRRWQSQSMDNFLKASPAEVQFHAAIRIQKCVRGWLTRQGIKKKLKVTKKPKKGSMKFKSVLNSTKKLIQAPKDEVHSLGLRFMCKIDLSFKRCLLGKQQFVFLDEGKAIVDI